MTCFIDSVGSDDGKSGLSEAEAVKSQARVGGTCTVLRYKRGSVFNEKLIVFEKVKTYGNYGDPGVPLPKFNNEPHLTTGRSIAMTTYFAFLRAINVAGHKPIAMASLRGLLERLGFDGPSSLLQTGNLTFRCETRKVEDLERLLEVESEKHLGLATDFFVRTAAELKAIVADNPFSEEARRDPAHLVLMLLKGKPAATATRALDAAIVGRERIRCCGRHAYIVYPDGIGRSRLTNALIEKTLATRSTGRNWNTILKLAALVG